MRLFPLLVLIGGLGACQDQEHSSLLAPNAQTAVQPKSGEPIPDRYIVVFREEVQDVQSVARTISGKYGGKLRRTYHKVLKGMSIQLPAAAATALSRDPFVAYVEQDQVVRVMGDPIVQPGATEGLDRIDQRFLPLSGTYSYSADGTGIRVYIIDTGINYGHTDFGGRAVFGYDDFGQDGSDCHGHGTHVAGTVGGTTYGVAKKVQLIAVRVLNCNGIGSLEGVIAGVEWVTANRVLPAVTNMSLQGGFSIALDNAVTVSIAHGITYAVIAGNNAGSACGYSPSANKDAITVAASDVNDVFASFSNNGSCVDIVAPGVDITSAWIGSANATAALSGTSMASPHVAGAAALFLSTNTGAAPAQVAATLTSTATAGVLTSVPGSTVNLLLHTGPPTGGSWTTRAALPSARRGHAVWAANGLLYAMGGINSAGTALRTVQAYNPSTNSWTSKASLPAARRAGNGATTINGIIYLAGGSDAAGALTRTLYAYNPSTNTWSTKANMPVYSGCGGSATYAGKLYVFSGCTRSSTGAQVPARLLHRYDPNTNSWTTLRPAQASHFQPVVAVISGKLYVAGGNNSSDAATGRVDMYDPATNTWSIRAIMPTPRVTAAGAAIGGKLHVVGGRNGPTYLNTVEVYDPLTDSWTRRGPMPTARAAFGAAGIGGLLYAVGGRNSTGVLAINQRYTP